MVEEMENYKYLGTFLDNRLNGEPQYNLPLRNLGFKFKTFGKIRRFLTTKASLMVYKSTILPIIDYNDLYPFLWNADKVNTLQNMQHWGLRTVYANARPKLGEGEMHEAAGLTVVSRRRISHILTLMFHRSKNSRIS